jgi:molecular chaperone GrpE (heat shock protein)
MGFLVPFLVGDVLLLGAALVIWGQGHRPMTEVEVGAFAGCVGLGALLAVWPFRLQQQAAERQAQTASLGDAVAQIGRVEELAGRIEAATALWQRVQDAAGRAAGAAGEIGDRIAAEHKEFRQFIEQADRTEREHLRLEVNKLRRAEGDWLQAQVRMLDHVYALYVAGVRSGQERIAEQLGQFQNACREAVRRVGLVVLQVPPGTAFETQTMQTMGSDGQVGEAPPTAVVEDTVATGFVFQGQLLRKAVVTVRNAESEGAVSGTDSFGRSTVGDGTEAATNSGQAEPEGPVGADR